VVCLLSLWFCVEFWRCYCCLSSCPVVCTNRWHCSMLWSYWYLCHSQWEWTERLLPLRWVPESLDKRIWLACVTSTSSFQCLGLFALARMQAESDLTQRRDMMFFQWNICFSVASDFTCSRLCLVIPQASYFDWKHQEAARSGGETKGKAKPLEKHTEAPEALLNNLKAQFQLRIYSTPNYFVALGLLQFLVEVSRKVPLWGSQRHWIRKPFRVTRWWWGGGAMIALNYTMDWLRT